jgi:uncharacterized protein (DUF427 family)
VVAHSRDRKHRIDVRPSSREVRAFVDGEVVAETHRALCLFETRHPTRYYIPPEDVRREFLIPSSRTSVCPYKGTASYWSLRVGDRVIEDAVWAYLDPIPECAEIKGYFSFYPEKLTRLDVDAETAELLTQAIPGQGIQT